MGDRPTVPIQGSEIIGALSSINTLHNPTVGRDPNAQGVFASFPAASPKYARHRLGRHHEFEDTMARMFIDVPPAEYNNFINSLPNEETQDIARVLCGDGAKKGGKGYFDFLLQGANHALNEKMQIVETLEDSYVAFFFGSSPPIWQYSGTLLNTYQDDWTMRMFRIYDELARGTQLAKREFILRLKYDSMIVSGAMTNFNWSLNSKAETYCPFSFSLLVKNVSIIYGGLGYPTKLPQDAHFLPDGFAYSEPSDAIQTDIACAGIPGGVQQTLVDTQQDWELTQEEQNARFGANPDVTGTVIIAPEIQLASTSEIATASDLQQLLDLEAETAGENLADALSQGDITEEDLTQFQEARAINTTQLERMFERKSIFGDSV